MRDFKGRTAFVTGGASGIGLGLARAFLGLGMNVMLADIEAASLDRALVELGSHGDAVRGLVVDVADRQALEQAAAAAIAAFGRVHVLCNNAGVAVGGPQEKIAPADWNWILGVNLMGVVHGIQAFLPHIKAHGEGGHIVNTASMAGLHSAPMLGPYCASKFAVVALSEGLAGELTGSGVGVSVLCPGWVRTRIDQSGRNRPQGAAEASPAADTTMSRVFAELIQAGMDPAQVAECVLDAIRNDDLYIVTHPDMRGLVEERFRRIQAAFDRSAAREAAGRVPAAR